MIIKSFHDNYIKDENGNTKLVSSVPYDMEVNPNWGELKKDLHNATDLFAFAIANATGNAFSALLTCIADGEKGNSTEKVFMELLALCQLNFNDSQKAEFNAILTKNYFEIQL